MTKIERKQLIALESEVSLLQRAYCGNGVISRRQYLRRPGFDRDVQERIAQILADLQEMLGEDEAEDSHVTTPMDAVVPE